MRHERETYPPYMHVYYNLLNKTELIGKKFYNGSSQNRGYSNPHISKSIIAQKVLLVNIIELLWSFNPPKPMNIGNLSFWFS